MIFHVCEWPRTARRAKSWVLHCVDRAEVDEVYCADRKGNQVKVAGNVNKSGNFIEVIESRVIWTGLTIGP